MWDEFTINSVLTHSHNNTEKKGNNNKINNNISCNNIIGRNTFYWHIIYSAPLVVIIFPICCHFNFDLAITCHNMWPHQLAFTGCLYLKHSKIVLFQR